MVAMLHYGTEEQVKDILTEHYKSDEYKIISKEQEEINNGSMARTETYIELLNKNEKKHISREKFEQNRRESIEKLESKIKLYLKDKIENKTSNPKQLLAEKMINQKIWYKTY